MPLERIAEIDHLKGAAILCVILIHSGPMEGVPFFDAVLNRAVPVFAVLSGLNFELWWRARAGRPRLFRWYTSRLRRILVPAWFCFAIWWAMVLLMAPVVPHSSGYLLAAFLGYAPWVGTSWFVTMVVQLVVLMPALRWIVDRVGVWIAGMAAAACTASCWLWMGEVTRGVHHLLGGMVPTEAFYFWIFSPRFFWHVVAGIAVARLLGGQVGRGLALGAALVFVAGTALRLYGLDAPLPRSALQALLDVPLTIALLGMFQLLRHLPTAASALAWLGIGSWGVYLAQLVAHNAVILSGNLMRIDLPGERWLYAAALTAVSILLAGAARALRLRFFSALAFR